MAVVVKKISMPLTLRAMKAGDVVTIPFFDIRPSTVYNAVQKQNIMCGWDQWEIKLIKKDGGKDYYEIRRWGKDERHGNE